MKTSSEIEQNQFNTSNPASTRYAARSGTKAMDRRDLPRIDFALRHANRRLSALHILNILRKYAPNLFDHAERKGKWVWLEFPGKQPPQVTASVSQLGFHYNVKRRLWQHPGGTFDPRARAPRAGMQTNGNNQPV